MSELYENQESGAYCHTISMSNVGTENPSGKEEIKSRNLRTTFNRDQKLSSIVTHAWYRAMQCISATSSSLLSKKPG